MDCFYLLLNKMFCKFIVKYYLKSSKLFARLNKFNCTTLNFTCPWNQTARYTLRGCFPKKREYQQPSGYFHIYLSSDYLAFYLQMNISFLAGANFSLDMTRKHIISKSFFKMFN